MGLDPEKLLDQIEADGDIQSSIKEVNSSNYGATDSTESAEELFGGSPF